MSDVRARDAGSQGAANRPPGMVAGFHMASVVAFLVGLLVVSALAVAAWSSHQTTEDRIMDRRTREAAAIFTNSIASIETSLASATDVVTSTSGDSEAFTTLMEPQVGEGKTFASASVWAIDGAAPQLLHVVGDEPRLADLPGEEVARLLATGEGPTGLRIIDLLGGDAPRIGYTYGTGRPTTLVAYVEAALPADRTSVPQDDSAFADLHYAIYLGERTPERLVLADVPDLPLEGRSSSQPIPFGDTELILQMSATNVLGSQLSAVLPWIILGVGALLAVLFGVLYERVLRRRDEADVLAAELTVVAEDNARLYSEQRSVAQTLQQSLLLDELPDVPGLELAARYEAGAEGVDVGGDWYDIIVRDDDCILFVVGDVSGRGVRAATVMAALRHSIRALALQGDDAATILTNLSRLVSVERDGHFATVLIIEINPHTGAMAVASAGHPRPIMVTDDGAQFVELDVGLPVGVAKEPTYRTIDGHLRPGATLLGFTDGLFERRGETVDTGLDRLREAVATTSNGSIERLLDELIDGFAGTPQDDAAILAVRWPTTTTPRPS